MKKFFTLISMAFIAMSMNAQTEDPDYLAIDDEKNFNKEFADAIVGDDGTGTISYVAKNIVNGQSVVTVTTDHVVMTAVSNGTPEDLLADDGYTQDQSFDNTNWPKWGDPKWEIFNKNKRIWHYNENNEVVTDFMFYAIKGTANPVTGFKSRVVLTNDVFNKLTADYEGYYFTPGVSKALPVSGEYFSFKADADGMFRIGFACPNGATRYMYIIRGSDFSVLTPNTEYKVEGYVNGVDNEKGEPKWQASIKVNDDYSIGNAEGTTWKDNDGVRTEQSFNELSQPKFGWFVFNAKANETYYILMPNTQFGFRDYKFTVGGNIDNYTPQDPTGIVAIKDDVTNAVNVNAPVYNLAGQKVNANAKGLLIKNGKKFMNK